MIKFIKFIFLLLVNCSLLFSQIVKADNKIKIGLLVPMTGSNKDIGESIIKAVRLAVKDIDTEPAQLAFLRN